MSYSELHCLSHFSFLRGASSPEELVKRASRLGYQALAITDECSLSGVVRAHRAAQECGLRLIIGAEITVSEGIKCVVLVRHERGYAELVALITQGRQADKGHYDLRLADLYGLTDCCLVWCPGPDASLDDLVVPLARALGTRFWIAGELHRMGCDSAHKRRLSALSLRLGRPIVAAGDVHMHARGRRALQDTMTAIRLKTPLSQAGFALFQNGERHLRDVSILEELYPKDWLRETEVIGEACLFSLSNLKYHYPRQARSARHSLGQLVRLTRIGLKNRYQNGVPDSVWALARHELAIIGELSYADYFLTVYDMVRFARSRGILCQGRGSAANSVVCYALGITAVDPARLHVLFERFVSRERNEPPDIDIDFEHERREEVIQYLYARYGRDHAAMTASIITYRARSALRDVAKALGCDAVLVDRLAGLLGWWEEADILNERLAENGYDVRNPPFRQLVALVRDLVSRPRHLSQHTGGMVLSQETLAGLIPIERAAMPGRTVLQWDKDDLDALRIMKVDCLGLGILTVLRKALALMSDHGLGPCDLHEIPAEDPVVYQMISAADTIGVFQIESRAQMALLPRLKPRTFYDLVIQIAIVRPGPIQGRMVHPYLRRRTGLEAVVYPSPEIEAVLARTLGIPLFQEQVIKLAVVAAGFTPGEADELRRAMGAWKREGDLEAFKARFLQGMRARGYSEDYAASLYQQIRGFGAYGFPESHAASFALLAYASAWLKCYVPDIYLCALLNSQPMGFYGPSQLIADARRHGVRILPPDVRYSQAASIVEAGPNGRAVRLGLGLIRSLPRVSASQLGDLGAESRSSLPRLAAESRLSRADGARLARAGALAGLCGSRPQALWKSWDIQPSLPLFADPEEPVAWRRKGSYAAEVGADYRALGFSLRGHPIAIIRQTLAPSIMAVATLAGARRGSIVTVAGLIITRQRPASGKGLIFLLLEDETGTANAIVYPAVAVAFRSLLLRARMVLVTGRIERTPDNVQHILVSQLARLPT
ncbi:MAG TPA: error-prone DNA polymerase [Acidiferrobacter sp.]|nr:error-prone DNA polymerase [Acidiferrobacter sp.]